MQVRYFVHHKGIHVGPLTFTEIEGQLNTNTLFPTDYVYIGDRGDWLPMLEFIMVHGPKEKVLQPTLKTLGAQSPDDDHIDWNRFASGIPATLGARPKSSQPVFPYPSMPSAAPPPLPKPFARPTPKAPPRIDASAVARVEVLPAQATRLTIQITGNARVGEELEIFVVAQTEGGEVDQSYNDVVQIACDRPLAGLGPLQFTNGTARLRVRCLTQGTHEFSLILGQSDSREFTSRTNAAEMANQGSLIH